MTQKILSKQQTISESNGMAKCQRCGELKRIDEFHPKNIGKYCKKCNSEYGRNWRIKNGARIKSINRRYYLDNYESLQLKRKEYSKTEKGKENEKRNARRARERYPLKAMARKLLRLEIAKGNVIKKPCAVCGEIKVEGHHFDYSKPLEVIWLCPNHHAIMEGRKIVFVYDEEEKQKSFQEGRNDVVKEVDNRLPTIKWLWNKQMTDDGRLAMVIDQVSKIKKLQSLLKQQ